MKVGSGFGGATVVRAVAWITLTVNCGCGGSSGSPEMEDAAAIDAAADASKSPLDFSRIGTPERIPGDFYFTEGPVWDPSKSVLYFSDINAHQAWADGGPESSSDASADSATQVGDDGGVDAPIPEAGGENASDGGADENAEAESEAGIDGGVDEAAMDGGNDGTLEEATDAGVEGGIEGGSDAGIDGGIESDGDGAVVSESGAGADGAGEQALEAGEEGGVDATVEMDASLDGPVDATIDAGAETSVEAGMEDGTGGSPVHTGTTVGGAIYRLTLPDTIDVLFQPSGNADGLALDPQGNILAAGFASRNVWRLSSSNQEEILAPCPKDGATCFDGQGINTPDDITSRSDGVIYFTDPTFGSGSQGFSVQSLPLTNAQGVYRLTRDGTLHLEDKSSSGPNGVNLSPDEKTLYVSYTATGEIAKFDVADDGSLSNKTTFATGALLADSMCVDSAGDVYVGTSGGLSVYDPSGLHLGTISVGGLIVTNCAFGDKDYRTLFITARSFATLLGAPPLGGGSLYQIKNMPVAGIAGQN